MNTKTFIPSRWLLLSALQKSIRRNRVELALATAKHLHQTEPANLLRRLKIIAVEDVACGNLPLVHRVLTTQKPDLPVILELVAAMCGSVKDRSACDLTEAINAELDDHALAKEAASLIVRRHLLSDDPLAKEVALIGYSETRQLLCFAIPLIAGIAKGSTQFTPDAFTNLPLIHGWPSEAWDMYTREGCSAYRQVLKHHPTLREELERWIEPGKVKEAFGYIMFAVESGKLDRRLAYPGSGEILALGQQADVCRFGVPLQAVDNVMRVVADALPAIHDARCRTVGFTHHNPQL